ncbi:hypothetical protein AcV5_006994 [Taiwanofungus camphoratus]|nr:hypothetical protein AcV5_006994 [Antrodia cinnamomea]KAI0958864.1 hypothetical protein AcV7_004562 [Antrodia cinnamomea]
MNARSANLSKTYKNVWELTLADARSCLTHPYVPIIVAVATRTCLIASDTIVLLVTWINVYKLKTVVGQGNTDLLSLLSSLLRDGTFYFVQVWLTALLNHQ